MADRYVRINVYSKGMDQAKKDFDDLEEKADRLTDERHDIDVHLVDEDAKARLTDMAVKLHMLEDERHDIELGVNDDAAKLKLVDLKIKLEALKHFMSDMGAQDVVDSRGLDKAERDLLRTSVAMDKLKASTDRTREAADKLKETTSGGWLERLQLGAQRAIFGGGGDEGGRPGGSNTGAEGGEGGPITGLLNNGLGGGLAAAGPQLYGPLAGLIASLLPGLAGFGVGGLSAVGGAAGAIFTHTGLEAKGSGLLQNLLGITKASTQVLVGPIKDIFGEIAGFAAGMIGPLSKMFKASIPFLNQFLKFLEDAAIAIIPQFTATMNEMVKSGALKEMTQALILLITDGLIPFLKVMGPGMKASAEVFKAVILSLDGVLVAIGALATYTAREFMFFGHAVTDVGKIFFDIGRIIVDLLTGNWKALGNAVKALGDNFRNFFVTLAQMLTVGFVNIAKFGHDVANVFDMLRHDVASIWDATWAAVSHAFASFYDDDLSKMQDFRHDVANIFDQLRHDVASIWDGLWSDVINRLHDGASNALSDLSAWWHTIESNFDTLRHTVGSTWQAMWNDIKTWTRDAVRGVSVAIHGIEGAFRTPVAWVVDNVWDRLAGIWNKIAGIVHLSSLKLPVAHMASGGVVPGTGRGDKVPAMLEPGERVLSNEQVASAGGHDVLDRLFGRGTGGPFGFSGGGIIGGIGGFLSGIGKDLENWVSKPLSFITSHLFGSVTSMLGSIPGVSNGMADVLKAMTTSLISDLGKQAKSGIQNAYSSKYTGKYGSGVAQWRGDVLRALAMEGLSTSLAGQVLYQMQTESGGNPNAINLTD